MRADSGARARKFFCFLTQQAHTQKQQRPLIDSNCHERRLLRLLRARAAHKTLAGSSRLLARRRRTLILSRRSEARRGRRQVVVVVVVAPMSMPDEHPERLHSRRWPRAQAL